MTDAERIAQLEAERDAALALLAMAREALQFTKRTVYGENGSPSLLGNGHNARYNCAFIKNWHKDPNCKIEETAKHAEELLLAVHQMTVAMAKGVDIALTATAPVVEEFVARLKADGAAEALRMAATARVAELLGWPEASGDDLRQARFMADWLNARADELTARAAAIDKEVGE